MFKKVFSPLARKIIFLVLGASLILTALYSAWETTRNYSEGIREIEGRFQNFEKTYMPQLSNALWHLDQDQLDLIISGIMSYPDVVYVGVHGKNKNLNIERGVRPHADFFVWDKKIEYIHQGIALAEEIGNIHITIDLKYHKKRTLDRYWSIWLRELTHIFIFASFLLLIIDKLVISRLSGIEEYLRRYDLSKSNQVRTKIKLDDSSPDEISYLARSVDRILATLQESYDQLDNELKARREAQDKMIELSEQVGRFQLTAGIFHDFNNLMQIAMSSIEIIKRRSPDMGINNFFVKIERSLHMMANLVRAQQEAAKKKDSASYHDLRELIEEVLTLEEHNLAKSGVQVIVDIPPQFEAYVAKNLFLLVILNLVKNAREAFDQVQQENKLIWIKAWSEGSNGRWSASVTDNGPGVPKEFQAKLFIHGETTKIKGHGFGISSCRRAVQMYRGDLTFEVPFENGEGARFILSMPVAAEALDMASDDEKAG